MSVAQVQASCTSRASKLDILGKSDPNDALARYELLLAECKIANIAMQAGKLASKSHNYAHAVNFFSMACRWQTSAQCRQELHEAKRQVAQQIEKRFQQKGLPLQRSGGFRSIGPLTGQGDARSLGKGRGVAGIVEQNTAQIGVPILFDNARADIKPEGQDVLHALIDGLRSHIARGGKVRIIGHADNTGEGTKSQREQHNKQLSLRRAQSVARFLQTHGKFPEAAFQTEGHGDKKPIATNKTSSGRLQNRRVVLERID
jgi:outer membrane protein OmpA-like peptidoglycan-associated protein